MTWSDLTYSHPYQYLALKALLSTRSFLWKSCYLSRSCITLDSTKPTHEMNTIVILSLPQIYMLLFIYLFILIFCKDEVGGIQKALVGGVEEKEGIGHCQTLVQAPPTWSSTRSGHFWLSWGIQPKSYNSELIHCQCVVASLVQDLSPKLALLSHTSTLTPQEEGGHHHSPSRARASSSALTPVKVE